jgi:hypothetical protein
MNRATSRHSSFCRSRFQVRARTLSAIVGCRRKTCLLSAFKIGNGVRLISSIAAAITGIVLLCGASPGPDNLPEEVAKHIADMSNACRQVNGKPTVIPTAEHGSLAPGLEFWAIDEATFNCKGAEGLFSGTFGSQVAVYGATSAGHARKTFAGNAYGMTVERSAELSRIRLIVAGRQCGQKGDPTHAEAVSCDRPLRWKASVEQLDFAPLSEIRIQDANSAASFAAKPDVYAGPSVKAVFSPASGVVCKDYSKEEFGYWVCPGPANYAVAFMDEGNLAGLTIGPARLVRTAAMTAQWLGASKVFGEKVQWIVREGTPKAAVVRIWRREDVSNPREIQELAIYAIDGEKACAYAAVDIHRPNANELAFDQAVQAAGEGCPTK